MKVSALKAPFPYFGGKRRVAHLVWPRFGNTLNYVEPFAGSLAVLLARPYEVRTETVNDKDAYLANFWRAVQHDPDQVAYYADWPVNEADLHARHLWLVNQSAFRERMLSDPEYYDAKIAGWWVWGISCWIGSGWCDANYTSDSPEVATKDGQPRPQLSYAQGVNVIKPRMGNPRPNLRPAQGVNGLPVSIPHLNGDSGAAGTGIHATAFDRKTGGIYEYMRALQDRLRKTRVVCGDWKRILGKSVTWKIGVTGLLFDPPYDPKVRQENLYAQDDSEDVPISTAVREWCLEEIEEGKPGNKGYFKGPRYQHPKMRIALCGYADEHGPYMPDEWECIAWKANGGYSNQNKNGNDNAHQERIWFSPHCLKSISALPIFSHLAD